MHVDAGKRVGAPHRCGEEAAERVHIFCGRGDRRAGQYPRRERKAAAKRDDAEPLAGGLGLCARSVGAEQRHALRELTRSCVRTTKCRRAHARS